MIGKVLDERLIAHRYKATRLSAVVGMVAMAAYLVFELVTEGAIRWDLFVIMGIMAATKLAAMVYYRRMN